MIGRRVEPLLRRIDWPLTGVVLLLLTVGLVNIHSASYLPDEDRHAGFALRQLFWIAIGMTVFVATVFLNYRRLGRLAGVFYLATLALLAVTLLCPEINGSRRWIPLGPINVQTSELAKISVILALARVLADRPPVRLVDYVGPFLLIAAPILLIVAQPDYGTAALFVPVSIAMIFVRGARLKHLAILGLIGLQLLPIGYLFLKPYHRARLRAYVAFADMDENRTMARGDGYQQHQSRTAAGNGGLLGRGWGQGSQTRLGFVPERHNDFIFSVICEEWGFLGAMSVLGLQFLMVVLCLAGADGNRDPFGRMLAVGITSLLCCQVLVNTGMTIGLVPVIGMTFPLVSYGGSSLVTTLLSLGLVMNVRMRPKRE